MVLRFPVAKTGDAVGGVLNATLGNLTELVIALAALQAGQYMLVKASIAGAIVTNTLFVLGASFLLGGLKHHVQEYNRVSARMQAGLLFLATIALLIPSAVSQADAAAGAAFTQKLSVGLAVLLIVAYGLGMLFSLKTHRELFGPFVSEARRLYQISFRLSVPCPSKSPPWSMVTGGNSGGGALFPPLPLQLENAVVSLVERLGGNEKVVTAEAVGVFPGFPLP